MKVTRKDIAKMAGVSTATVSYVINGSNRVGEETRERQSPFPYPFPNNLPENTL